jgi:hypothetical protein
MSGSSYVDHTGLVFKCVALVKLVVIDEGLIDVTLDELLDGNDG